jgi:hypothetical protein
MPVLNWGTFEGLPGAATTNFELLCRSAIRRQYGQFGKFRALANQPGVEFHLRLHTACDLGELGRWFGWQCRWYSLASGTNIGAARRAHIKEAIEKSEKALPDLTDWILWTRHTLTKSDQDWFYGLHTRLKLNLWSGIELEDHLVGPAEILRETYFGELVLTPDLLKDLHDQSVAPIRQRWIPEVHQTVKAERILHRTLGEAQAWDRLGKLEALLRSDTSGAEANIAGTPATERTDLLQTLDRGKQIVALLRETQDLLQRGEFEILAQRPIDEVAPSKAEWRLAQRLRARRHLIALYIANVLADMQQAGAVLTSLRRALAHRLVIVTADAGCGKTQMSAQLTAATSERSAGFLLRGKLLSAGQTLDELARRVSIRGKPVTSFESLIAAVDAAGQRQGRRLPIVIDGLNEAEDPRDWKDQLASFEVILARYPNIQLICTLRSAFVSDAVPSGARCLEIPGFEHDVDDAVRKYFAYYKIDAADAEIPWELLEHPLTLRMFCDVANPERKRAVGVGSLPSSLATLFQKYLDQVADRISELSPSVCRYFPTDVHGALNKIGVALWVNHARDLDISDLRRLLGDDGRSWDHSIIRAFEQDGILFREPGDRSNSGRMSIVYDALAGHVIADALLGEYAGPEFQTWIRSSKTRTALSSGIGERRSLTDKISRVLTRFAPEKWAQGIRRLEARLLQAGRTKHHPLASDILRALVGLTPYRMNRLQLWPLLDGQLRADALFESAYMDGSFIDRDTVTQLVELVRTPPPRHRDLLHRLFVTRAALSHPLNADFLDRTLRPMSMADRDLRWSEWVRRASGIKEDIERLDTRWRQGQIKERADHLRARWVMWTLTTTNRSLRDHATRALYWFGVGDPNGLFELALDSLRVNDPYVPERMLAACYGVAMGLWADPRATALRAALPTFASTLTDLMFVPDAPCSTFHTLTRGYALGTITLAQKIDPNCIDATKLRYLSPPFDHLHSPFPAAHSITDAQIAGIGDAMRMDFENYTLGRLMRDRGNYDFENATYKEVRRQIEFRIADLGYSPGRFGKLDIAISQNEWHRGRQESAKVDRYGKKYSWIAFFEMYALRADKGLLSEWRDDERPSDADIDPSFPDPPLRSHFELPEPFSASPADPLGWLSNGATPDYSGLLQVPEIDGHSGPWLLLQGYVEQSAPTDKRRAFSFLRGIIVNRELADNVISTFLEIEYPGNRAIPEPLDDYYTYAGEIPWSRQFGATLRDASGSAARDEREAFEHHDGKRWLPGIPVEIPAYDFAWESYHSELNQAGGVTVPAPAVCEQLGLSNRRGEWDYYDRDGRLASIYRRFKNNSDTFDSHLLYLRADLIAQYLAGERDLVWLVWGERGVHFEDPGRWPSEMQEAFAAHQHIHQFAAKWQG